MKGSLRSCKNLLLLLIFTCYFQTPVVAMQALLKKVDEAKTMQEVKKLVEAAFDDKTITPENINEQEKKTGDTLLHVVFQSPPINQAQSTIVAYRLFGEIEVGSGGRIARIEKLKPTFQDFKKNIRRVETLVKKLITGGSSIRIKNNAGYSPYDYWQGIIVQAKKDFPGEADLKSLKEDIKFINNAILLRLKSRVEKDDTNAQEDFGYLLLMKAAELDSGYVAYLIKEGADVNYQDDDDNTALHRAFGVTKEGNFDHGNWGFGEGGRLDGGFLMKALNKRAPVIKALVNAGARIDLANKAGKTAGHFFDFIYEKTASSMNNVATFKEFVAMFRGPIPAEPQKPITKPVATKPKPKPVVVVAGTEKPKAGSDHLKSLITALELLKTKLISLQGQLRA